MDVLNELQGEVEPDIILIPDLQDPHQDHATVGNCAVRTYRSRETILQYEILRHGSATFTPNLYVDITAHLEKKLDAVKCYESQKTKRKFFDADSIQALAKTRGFQSGYDYAEGYQVYRIFV
jgi:LmbE family N-acetylglucosaminyl deacetylase